MHKDLSSGCIACEGDRRGAFVHRFATPQHKYLFDVNTSRILRVPPVAWDIVDDFGVLTKAELISKHSVTYSSAALIDAYDAMLAARQMGLLLPNRPSQIAVPWDEKHIQERLSGHRTSVSLVVTEQCNFRCAYCVYGGSYATAAPTPRRSCPGRPPGAAFDEFLDHSGQVVVHTVHFYGGEPLLNLPLIRRSMEYIHEHRRQTDVQFAMTTNGSLLEGEAADLLARFQARIAVSLDGPEHVHDRYRRLADGSGTWQRVMHNLRTFLEKFPQYRHNRRLRFHAVIAPPGKPHPWRILWRL